MDATNGTIEDDLLTTAEVAERLGYANAARVRHLIAEGRLRCVKRGRDLFVPVEDVERFTRRKRGPKPRRDAGHAPGENGHA